jgi:hypothetical protein
LDDVIGDIMMMQSSGLGIKKRKNQNERGRAHGLRVVLSSQRQATGRFRDEISCFIIFFSFLILIF